jgi:hypothetical protein
MIIFKNDYVFIIIRCNMRGPFGPLYNKTKNKGFPYKTP